MSDNYVLIQHLVLEGSLDSKMVNTIIRKQAVADRALDNVVVERMAVVEEVREALDNDDDDLELPEQLDYSLPDTVKPKEWRPEMRSATHGTTREQLEKKAAELSSRDIELVHFGLQKLAAVCDGAVSEDFVGFNGTDSRVGKELAARTYLDSLAAALGWYLLRKYSKTQLEGVVDELYMKEAKVETAIKERER